jgi:hypothetical protein
MKKHTENRVRKDPLNTAIDALTEENQQYVLGVLEALCFAQAMQKQAGNNRPVEADKNNIEGALL